MTLYARADVLSVSVPSDTGGCGTTHIRPVVNGAPVKTWALTCGPCETYLRADIARAGGNKKVRTINGDTGMKLAERFLGLWGGTPDTIPEAPDDELKREHDEHAMITKNAASQTETLAQIGSAVAGNAELMAKFIELQLELTKQQAPSQGPFAPIPPVPVDEPEGGWPEPRKWEYPVGGVPAGPEGGYNLKYCTSCGTPIERKPGQRGALPKLCGDCKQKKAA